MQAVIIESYLSSLHATLLAFSMLLFTFVSVVVCFCLF